jgi:hypothetical protein
VNLTAAGVPKNKVVVHSANYDSSFSLYGVKQHDGKKPELTSAILKYVQARGHFLKIK